MLQLFGSIFLCTYKQNPNPPLAHSIPTHCTKDLWKKMRKEHFTAIKIQTISTVSVFESFLRSSPPTQIYVVGNLFFFKPIIIQGMNVDLNCHQCHTWTFWLCNRKRALGVPCSIWLIWVRLTCLYWRMLGYYPYTSFWKKAFTFNYCFLEQSK